MKEPEIREAIPSNPRDWWAFEHDRLHYIERCRHVARGIVRQPVVKRALNNVRSEIEEIQMLACCSSYETLLEISAELSNSSDYKRLKDYCGVREDLWGTNGEYWITEGWLLSENTDYGLQIERFDDDPRQRFSCDVDAVAYVSWRASMGSEYHADALAEVVNAGGR